jgi:C-terminal processing protease CtpA/Prc
MKRNSQNIYATLLLLVLLALAIMPAFAQNDDDKGVTVITGEVNYTVGFLSDFGYGSVTVVLSDSSSFVDQARRPDRIPDPDYVVPESGQFLGYVTSDPLVSPFTYEIRLPIVPVGEARDVDNDGEDDAGVVINDISVFVNVYGTVYWDQNREYGAGFSSLLTTTEFTHRYEPIGGKFVVWSPDNQQGFPSGLGEDGLLFTDDDPIITLQAGYTVVDIGTDPFTFDRSAIATVDLVEQEQSLQPADYTNLSYTAAFDALIDQMRREYSFTEYKGVDWDALYEEFAPRIAEAEANNDAAAFQFAIRDFTWSIPDGHVGANLPLTNGEFFTNTDGGLGMAIRETDDGRVIVNYLTPGGPAENAGIQLGAEIFAWNGVPILEALPEVVTYAAPYSTSHNRRLQELRYITRSVVGSEVEVKYQNPDSEETQTAVMISVDERDSWRFSSIARGSAPPTALPVEFSVLDSGYGYARVNTFSENPTILLSNWEWMVKTLNANNIPGLVIDLRWNGGGYNLYNQLAGYFTREEVIVGTSANYVPGSGTPDEFFVDPIDIDKIRPNPDGIYYDGKIVVIVSPNCASACEFFGYALSLLDNVTVVGFYPTAGLGGNITPVYLPDGLYFQFTTGRALDAEGNIRLEGIGVVPDIDVPVNEETLFAEGDVLLDTAVAHLDSVTSIPVNDGGVVEVGIPVEGELVAGERIAYTFETGDGGTFDIVLSDPTGNLDTVLRIYIAGQTSVAAENDDDEKGGTVNSGFRGIELPANFTLILEVAGYEDAQSGAFTLTITPVEGE